MGTERDTHELENAHRLSELKPGQAATVERLEVAGEQRWRLMDLGLLPGTYVVAELRGPFGDPTAYRVRGALIALRREQARLIHIKRENGIESSKEG
jgi:Fe2+ transport system protein FeoA